MSDERAGPPVGTISERMAKRRTNGNTKAITEPARKETKALVRRQGRPSDSDVGALAYAARLLPGGRKGMVELARACSDEKVQALVSEWDALSPSAKRKTKLEDLCERALISPGDFISRVAKDALETGLDVSRLVLGMNHPRVLQKTIQFAMQKDGQKDRENLFKASGFLPTPQGVNIQNIAQAKAGAQVVTEAPRGLQTLEAEMSETSRAVKGA